MTTETTRIHVSMDPYTPQEMAHRIEVGGVAKANLDAARTFVLAILGGSFIALGAVFSLIVTTNSNLGFGMIRLVGGMSFSLGLVLVLVGGAELFTGNALLVMAWGAGRVSARQIFRNWAIVYVGNLIGATLTAWGIWLSNISGLDGGRVGDAAVALAHVKLNLSFVEATVRGIFCNVLVCLAVWLGFSARSTTDKILCIVFPVSAFVAAGFEHSIANMFVIPYAMMIDRQATSPQAWIDLFTKNLFPVTAGNIVGGVLMVGLVYWFIFLRKANTAGAESPAR